MPKSIDTGQIFFHNFFKNPSNAIFINTISINFFIFPLFQIALSSLNITKTQQKNQKNIYFLNEKRKT